MSFYKSNSLVTVDIAAARGKFFLLKRLHIDEYAPIA